jgi:hypothetical protein
MRKLLAVILMIAFLATPAFAGKKPHRQPHHKYDYRYHTPKYKVPKSHHRQPSHPHNDRKSQSQ